MICWFHPITMMIVTFFNKSIFIEVESNTPHGHIQSSSWDFQNIVELKGPFTQRYDVLILQKRLICGNFWLSSFGTTKVVKRWTETYLGIWVLQKVRKNNNLLYLCLFSVFTSYGGSKPLLKKRFFYSPSICVPKNRSQLKNLT